MEINVHTHLLVIFYFENIYRIFLFENMYPVFTFGICYYSFYSYLLIEIVCRMKKSKSSVPYYHSNLTRIFWRDHNSYQEVIGDTSTQINVGHSLEMHIQILKCTAFEIIIQPLIHTNFLLHYFFHFLPTMHTREFRLGTT